MYAVPTQVLVGLDGHAKRDFVVKAIEEGRAVYSGGVVRYAAGQHDAGQPIGGRVLAHLQPPPDVVKDLVSQPSDAIANALSLPASASALGLVNVGLSAVNTGIAAYNTYQLHRIQQGIDRLESTTTEIVTAVGHLGFVTGEIRHLAAAGLATGEAIHSIVTDLRRWAVREPELELASVLEALRDQPDTALDRRLDAVRGARHAFEAFLGDHEPAAADAQQLLQAGHLVRLWSTAATLQVSLLAVVADPAAATRSAADLADSGRRIATAWINSELADRNVLAAHPALLRDLPVGAWQRIANAHAGTPHRALDGAAYALEAIDSTGAAAITTAEWSGLGATMNVVDALLESSDVLASQAELELAA